MNCPHCGNARSIGRATLEELETLHRLVAEALLVELCRQRDKTGSRNGSSRLMSVILAFLKDNGINAPTPSQRAVDALAAEMPDFDAPAGEQAASDEGALDEAVRRKRARDE